MIFNELFNLFLEGRIDIYLYTSYRGTVEKLSDGKIKKDFELDRLEDFLDLSVKSIKLKRYFDKNSYEESNAKPLIEVTLVE